ncbi:hypothetical protein ACHAW6_008347 [Cyclotella cf. meneghiniana]
MSHHLFSLSCVLLPLLYAHTDAFTPLYNSRCYEPGGNRIIISAATTRSKYGRILNSALFSSNDHVVEEGTTNPDLIDQMAAAQKRETPKLTEEDIALIQTLYKACDGNQEAMENAITADLDNMHPRLVVALQLAADKGEWKEDNAGEEFEQQIVALGSSLQNVLDTRLRSGRELLADLLNSGEIRKLDSMIGKAAKDGKLDMSFFSVLGMNMKDAAMSGETMSSPTLAAGEGQEEVKGEAGQPIGANRLQILQHIYTRCQEELEKTVAPGIGLLNKLLRTDISSIRSNQLSHYLGPQATTITSPDGKTIDLGGTGKPLVSHIEFIEALSNAVNQIRTLEAAGGTDRLSAVNLIESIRQVAMEARGVLVESFGEGSEVVQEFQRELQPVFRPGSTVEK